MKPTDEQKLLIQFFVKELKAISEMDVSEYTSEIQHLGEKIDDKLARWGKDNQHLAGDAIRDIAMTIVNNP